MSNLRKSISLGLLGLIAGGFMVISAQAQQGSPRGPGSFDEFDLDGNGFVSEDEFNTVRGQRVADRATEGRPMRGLESAPAFADIDTDGDGQLNQAELAAGQQAHMGQGSGKGMGTGQGMGRGPGAGQGMGQGAGQGMGMIGNMPVYADFDLDGDGKIVEQEFNKAHSERMSQMATEGRMMKNVGDFPGFAGIDTNDDGVISQQEFTTHQAEHRQQMQQGQNK